MTMKKCPNHADFFDDSCQLCREEYLQMKGLYDTEQGEQVPGKYKELTEERAKKLYEELMLQYIKNGTSEFDADKKAKAILRKQCRIRGIAAWPWI